MILVSAASCRPFLETHKHQEAIGSTGPGFDLVVIKPEFNRAEYSLNVESRSRIHPMLFEYLQKFIQNYYSV